MIIGPVSLLDCFVFCIFLAPQLLLNIGLFPTFLCVLRATPFLIIKLPLAFIYEHLILSPEHQSPFVQQATYFEDVVVRCVRYAFASIPAEIGQVFFSKNVALPFLRFRLFRHGFFSWPMYWEEIRKEDFEGVWIIDDKGRKPDLVILYAHGGGFAMGSSYFYLEFLFAFLSLLKGKTGFHNPAILSVDYSLIPNASYPTQVNEMMAAYRYAVSIAGRPSNVVACGDSAGATLILSLLLHLGKHTKSKTVDAELGNGDLADQSSIKSNSALPGMVVLISPWVTLLSPLHHNTPSDYLDKEQLDHYAHQYCGNNISANDALVSPGKCTDISWWQRSIPKDGIFIIYGAEEVFTPEIRKLVTRLESAGISVHKHEQESGIHAWPVASLFLSSTRAERLKGLDQIATHIQDRTR